MPRTTAARGTNTSRKPMSKIDERACFTRKRAANWPSCQNKRQRLHLSVPVFGHKGCSTCGLRKANIGFAGGQNLCQQWYPVKAGFMLPSRAQLYGRIKGMGSRTPSRTPPQHSNLDGPDQDATMQQSPAAAALRNRTANAGRSDPFPNRTCQINDATFAHGAARWRIGQVSPSTKPFEN